jgi:sphingomyelin phosphodiesterase 2
VDGAAGIGVATLNTLGAPSRLSWRYREIGRAFEASPVDVACLQEVMSYVHLRLLTRAMPSFRHAAWRPSVAGPAGGLVVLSRRPLTGRRYAPFPPISRSAAPSRTLRLVSRLKGTLVVSLQEPEVYVMCTHPLANRDGDWRPGNRFEAAQRSQLDALAGLVRGLTGPVIVCGDFNVPGDTALHEDFRRRAALEDAFGGTYPVTFRPEFLPPGRTPRCIDFILCSQGLRATEPSLLFGAEQPGGGFVSDHLGLSAHLTPAAH